MRAAQRLQVLRVVDRKLRGREGEDDGQNAADETTEQSCEQVHGWMAGFGFR
jgi:hypothetical protein